MSGVRDTSLIAYEKKRASLTKDSDQDAALSILEELGPMDDVRILEALNQKEQVTLKPKRKKRKWTINLVTPRRGELVEMGLVEDLGQFKHPDRKQPVHLWRAGCDKRQPIGWKKVPGKEVPRKDPAELSQQRTERTEKVQRPILRKLRASEAGRTLQEYRKFRRRKTTAPTGQRMLFA